MFSLRPWRLCDVRVNRGGSIVRVVQVRFSIDTHFCSSGPV